MWLAPHHRIDENWSEVRGIIILRLANRDRTSLGALSPMSRRTLVILGSTHCCNFNRRRHAGQNTEDRLLHHKNRNQKARSLGYSVTLEKIA
jgi:hypothetical protein